MSETTNETNCFLVVSHGPRDGYVLAVQGEGARQEVDAVGHHIEDHSLLARTIPEAPGIYVWEGRIVWLPYGLEDSEPTFVGAWTPATAEDFAAFGMPLAVPA